MKSQKINISLLLIICVGLLITGSFFTGTATTNNGMPERLLNGEFGNKINLFRCLNEDPCFLYISSSESSYVLHGLVESVKDYGNTHPFLFQLFIDGHEIQLQRFSHVDKENNMIGLYFYKIFDVGTFSEGTYSIMGIWTENDYFQLTLSGTLVVSP